MVWRKPGGGLDFDFTSKGSYEGTGERVAHFMAAIAYGKRVIAAEQHFWRNNTDKFFSLFMNTLQACLRHALTKRKLFQHGDPSQNSCKTRSA